MSFRQWTQVDQYLTDTLIPPDVALDAALRASAEAGLPAINVTANHGKLLNLLVRISGARTVLELGTLGGYSTIWLARGLPADGRVVTLEAVPEHAAVARSNLERAGVAGKVDVRVGPALETLPRLAAEHAGPFDLVFIDADKPNNPRYLEWALALTRPGSIIVCDNVVRDGHVIDADSGDGGVQGVREFLAMTGGDPRLDATALQTVGAKGWDGFSVAVVR